PHFVWVCAIGCLLLAFASYAQQAHMPTAATDAKVTADSAIVFQEMDISSDHVSTLKKGDSVYVDLRMDQGGRSWCGVRPSRQANRTGFVECRGLERVANSVPIVNSGRGAFSPEPSHRAPVEVPLARPATPTANGYAAMKNQVVKEG